jgi:hypothetical protein
MVHGENFLDPNQLIHETSDVLEEFHKANISVDQTDSEGVGNESSQNMESWTPPPSDYFKLNWDAVVNVKQGIIGLGCVVRT